MSRWETLVRRELEEAKCESKPTLRDSLPKFLDHLAEALKQQELSDTTRSSLLKVAREHGDDRVQHTDYTLDQVIREYDLLRKVIFDILEEDNLLHKPVRETILDVVATGMAKASGQFAEVAVKREEELRKSELRFRESEKKFRGFAEAMPQIAFIADADGKIIYYNRRHYEYFGVCPGETEDWAWKDKQLHHPDDLQRTIDTWQRAIKTGEPYEIEYRLRRHDGECRWHLGRAAPQRDESGKIIRWFGTNTDIQEQKELEHKQRQLIVSLQNERELREKFVNTLTHDLRTPLSVIRMSAQILEMETDNPEFAEFIKRILKNVALGDQMIRDLLDTNRIRAGRGLYVKIQKCLMSEVVYSAIQDLEVVHGKRFQVTVNGICDGFWDPNGIRRITENLTTNAVKYGDSKTPIVIQIDDLGEEVQLSVQNRGPVIKLEDQKNLFAPFSRSVSAESGGQKGWGIGLTIVKGIADAHCAEVALNSNEKDGTKFYVTFPRDPRPYIETKLKEQEAAK